MDRVSAVARPISGTWLNDTVKKAFRTAEGPEDVKNGMDQVIYNVIYGYESGADKIISGGSGGSGNSGGGPPEVAQ
jgi:hypothetical protein